MNIAENTVASDYNQIAVYDTADLVGKLVIAKNVSHSKIQFQHKNTF